MLIFNELVKKVCFMEILAHRGVWVQTKEKNSIYALEKAFFEGVGIETDVRDYDGELVVSHDIADNTCELFETILDKYVRTVEKKYIAINIKADGLQEKLITLLEKYKINKYFVFDMSVPEMVVYSKNNINFFTRHSDIEPTCVLYEKAQGVWLDSFYSSDWLSLDIMAQHLNNKKMICIISPEIHGFEYMKLWEMIKNKKLYSNPSVMLCTDKPSEARRFFGL